MFPPEACTTWSIRPTATRRSWPGRFARSPVAASARVFAPYPLVWALMLGVDLVSLLRHRKLGTARYRLRRTLAPMRTECAAARKDLGWRPRVRLAEGLSTGTERRQPHGRRRRMTARVASFGVPRCHRRSDRVRLAAKRGAPVQVGAGSVRGASRPHRRGNRPRAGRLPSISASRAVTCC